MNLEQRLKTKGSTYTQADGRDVAGYDGISKLDPINLYNSNLDLNGITPVVYDRQTQQEGKGLRQSTLDLNGVNPTGPLKDSAYQPGPTSFDKGTYRNYAPEGRSF